MAQQRVITEGFDLYPGLTDDGYGLGSTWSGIQSSVNGGALVAGRFGGQAYRPVNNNLSGIGRRVIPATREIVYGFAVYISNITIGVTLANILSAATANIFELRTVAGGYLSVTRNGTLVGQSAVPVLTAASWHYIECACKIDAATGSVRVFVNDFEVPSLALNNVNTGNVDTGWYQFGRDSNPGGNTLVFDDMYVDVGGLVRAGEGRIFVLRPNADIHTDFARSAGANNYGNVDDVPASIAAYNSSTTVDAYDMFGLEDMPLNPQTIFGVQLTVLGQKDEAAARAIRGLLKSGAAPTEETADFPLALGSPQFFRQFFPTDPNTGAAFLKAGVDALNIGYKVSV